MKFILKYIFIISIISLNLYSRERMLIAVIDLDNSLRANESFRKELVKTINRFAYLKQKTSISIDREKKKLFSTNKLTLEEGLTIASNFKVKAAIIMDSEKILKNTNNISNYNILSNENEIKDLGDLIEESIGKKIEKTEEIDKSNEELYEIMYNFKVIDMNTGDILNEYKLKNHYESISVIQEICIYLEFYFSNFIFKSIESPINGININVRIERITLENKTNAIYDKGEIIEGESFTINFRSNNEGYLYIFAFQNDGNTILMYPNDFNNEYQNKIEARKNYIIPPENSKFNIKIRYPLGEDAFYCLYTRKEQKWITGLYFLGDGFKICDKNKIAEFTSKLKSKLKSMNNDDWQIYKIYLKSIKER